MVVLVEEEQEEGAEDLASWLPAASWPRAALGRLLSRWRLENSVACENSGPLVLSKSLPPWCTLESSSSSDSGDGNTLATR